MTTIVNTGDIFRVKLMLPPNDKSKTSRYNPGDIIVNDLNTEYIQIIALRWNHNIGDSLPYLELKLKALKAGNTDIIYNVQLDSFNPLFVERVEHIEITTPKSAWLWF